MEKTKQVLEYLVKLIVNDPDAVFVDATTDELGVLLTLHVAPSDMGLIIGRSGSTAKSLRVILRTIGMTERARVNLRIAEPVDAHSEAHIDDPL